MVTYVLQAITTLLFGPMVALFAIYTQTDAWSTGSSSKPKHRFQELISNLAFSVFQANVFACLAVSIGCLVREVEISPLAEVSFINTLGVLEMMILLGIVLSATACYDYTSRYLIVMFIYGVPVFAFSMAVTLLRGYPSSQTKILEKITGFCIEERDYPFFSMRDDDARTNRFLGIFMGSFYGGIFALIIIWMLIYKYCKPIANPIIKVYEAVTGFFLNLWKRFARLLHADPGRLFFGIAATFYGVVWAYSSIVLLISLQNQRISLQRVLGAAYEDSQWGFGQITAIILWAPLLHDLIMEIIGKFKPSLPHRYRKRSLQQITSNPPRKKRLPSTNPPTPKTAGTGPPAPTNPAAAARPTVETARKQTLTPRALWPNPYSLPATTMRST